MPDTAAPAPDAVSESHLEEAVKVSAATPEREAAPPVAKPAWTPPPPPPPPAARVGRVEREVPGCPGEVMALEMDAEHRIWVHRPSAWGAGFRESPERYLWDGNVPGPTSKGAPGKGAYTADDQAWADPMVAVIKANRPNHRDTKDDKVLAHAAWAELWDDFRPFLEPRAAGLAEDYGYPASLYTRLCMRPDLADHLQVCPALGPFMTLEVADEIPPTGWNLQQVAGFLLAPVPKDGSPRVPVKVSPGFMAWARGLKWDKSQLPAFPKDAALRFPALRAFVRMAHELGTQIDPNGIQQIGKEEAWKKINFPMDEGEAWLLLNTAIAGRRTLRYVPHILKSPASAVKAVERYFPPDMKIKTRERISMVFEAVTEWVDVADEATRIAGTPGVLKRYPAFTKLTEEAREWDREMRLEEMRQSQEREAEIARRAADQELQAQLAHERALAVIHNAAARGARYLLPATIDPAKMFPVAPKTKRVADDKYQMIYLASGAMVQEESVTMNHCVASFHAPQCVSGTEILLSVRKAADVDSQPLATIAIKPQTGNIMEMHGKGNSALQPEMVDWIKGKLREMLHDGLEVDPDFQAEAARPRR